MRYPNARGNVPLGFDFLGSEPFTCWVYMSFEISIDNELRVVVIRATSVVGPHDIRAAVDDVVAFPGFEPGMGQILDLTEGGLKMDGAGSKELAQFFQSAEVREKLGSGYKFAVVATRASDFGVARMYEAHEVDDSIVIRVFYSLKDARRWICAPELYASPERQQD